MIVIVDYGISNIGAVKNALDYLKIDSKISSSTSEIAKAKKIIIPGNGNFGEGIKLLKKKAIDKVLHEQILYKKKPVLGICLGYQLMFEKSEEDINSQGLGWIKGSVHKFIKKKNYSVPHVGWNNIRFKNLKVMKGIPNDVRFYFDHSYYPIIKNNHFSFGNTEYIVKFPSIYEKANIVGCQPHLEKSQKYGLKMLKNFSQAC